MIAAEGRREVIHQSLVFVVRRAVEKTAASHHPWFVVGRWSLANPDRPRLILKGRWPTDTPGRGQSRLSCSAFADNRRPAAGFQVFALAFSFTWPSCSSTEYCTTLQPYCLRI